MKVLKLLVIISLTFSFTNCTTVKLTPNPLFKVAKATYNNWVGGQPGVSGLNVVFEIEDDKDNIMFKEIYFQNKNVKASIKKSGGNKLYITANFDTSNRRELASERILNQGLQKKETNIESKENIPFKLASNEAVIKYTKGKKTFYYKVKNIQKIKTVIYP